MNSKITNEYTSANGKYQELKQKALDNTKDQYFSDKDILFLEPYFCELNNIPTKDFKFFVTDEDFSSASKLFEFGLDRSIIHYKTEFLSPTIMIETLYEYFDNHTKAYTFYVKDIVHTIQTIESLESDKNGKPSLYQKIASKEHYITNKYIHEDSCIHLVCGESTPFEKKYEIHLSPGDGSISNIYRMDQGKKVETVYDTIATLLSLEDLGEKVLESLFKEIYSELESNNIIKENVACLLLEYAGQNPFPPAIAINSRKNHIKNGLNGPDMDYFSEEGPESLNINFQNEYIYENLNEQIDNLYDQAYSDKNNNETDSEEDSELNYDNRIREIDSIVSSIYIQVCKRLTKETFSKSLPKKSKNFFITARNFSTCNEQEITEQVLPSALYKKVEKQLFNEENNASDLDNLETFTDEDTKNIKTLKKIELEYSNKYSELAQLSEKNVEAKYFDDNDLYNIDPYFFYIEKEKAPPEIPFYNQEPSKENTKNLQYEYGLMNNKIIYKKDKYSKDSFFITFYDYSEKTESAVLYRVKGSSKDIMFFEKTTLSKEDTLKPVLLEIYGQERVKKTDYKYTHGLIEYIEESKTNYYYDKKKSMVTYKHNMSLKNKITYNSDNSISRITQKDNNYVYYSDNNQFLTEEINLAIDSYFKKLIALLNSKIEYSEKIIAYIIFNYDTQLPIYPSVILIKKDSLSGKDHDIESIDMDQTIDLGIIDMDIHNNLSTYIIRGYEDCIDSYYHQLSDKIEKSYFKDSISFAFHCGQYESYQNALNERIKYKSEN